ncbi:MAG: prepilin-type N-terminal cleavage/methylation domain-containing protein [Deinococcaceae bacterium]
MSRDQRGFTLIELMLAAGIMVLLLGLVLQGIQSGGQGTALVTNRSELMEDVRVAGQIMSDVARDAVYVYPPGTVLTLKTAASGGDYRVKNPRTGDNKWTVGQDNILAFIKAPAGGLIQSSGATTPICDPLAAETSSERKACLSFVAYYALKRKDVVDAAPGINNPGADPFNTENGILYEYRLDLSLDRLDASVTNSGGWKYGPPPTTIGGDVTGNFGAPTLLADNIKVNPGGVPPYRFILKPLMCRDKTQIYVDSSGNKLPYTPNTSPVKYDTSASKFKPGCPSTLQSSQLNADGSLNYLATMVQASFTLESARSNNLGGNFTSSEMNFAVAPQNLWIKELF